MSNKISPSLPADSLPCSIFIFDIKDNRFVYANPEFEDLLGYTLPEIQSLGSRFLPSALQCGTEDDVPSCLSELQKLEPGQTFSFVDQMRDRAKRQLKLNITVAAHLHHADGSIKQVLGTVQNLTQSVKTEKRLRESEGNLNRLTNVIPGAVYQFRLSKEGEMSFPFISRGAKELFGYEAEELEADFELGWNAIYPKDVEALLKSINNSAKSLEPWTYNFRFRTKDGVLKWIRGSSVPEVPENDGSIIWNGVFTDISEHKRLEENLDAARERAESANRAKSLFLANMSHEIRTPMNALMGMCELLYETSLDEEQEECLDTIRNSGKNLLSLLNNILDLSKMEASKLDIECIPFNLQDWLQETLALFSSKIFAKNLDFICDEDENLPLEIHSDPNRLRQILINLLSNATKFTMHGEIIVAASIVEQFSDRSALLRFSISDSGIGIGEDKLKYIFEAFNQGDDSTARYFGGTGLGLTISERLTKMMGGDLAVESDIGKGSTFTFTVKVFSITPAPNLHIKWENEKKALIFEDSTAYSDLVLKLKRLNISTLIVNKADKAVRLLEDDITSFKVIFIDAQWLRMQVESIADKIISLANNSNLPLVVIYSPGKPDSLNGKLRVPSAVRLFKPILIQHLREKLLQVLRVNEEKALEIDGINQLAAEKINQRKALKILLVEDPDTSQVMTIKTLERLGFDPDLAANGLEALELLNRKNYDVILMDIQMSNMSGLEVTKRIREDFPPDRQPRIVALAASVMHDDHEACLEAGMDFFLPKPINISMLSNAIDSVTDRHY